MTADTLLALLWKRGHFHFYGTAPINMFFVAFLHKKSKNPKDLTKNRDPSDFTTFFTQTSSHHTSNNVVKFKMYVPLSVSNVQ